jgi:renalase
MQEQPAIAIIGAGIAGLTCARELAVAGLEPVVFEKGRGPGGRVATRRNQTGAQFDHGAQYVTARDGEFQRLMESMAEAGDAATWFTREGEAHWVGRPRMNRIGHHLGAELDIVTGSRVDAVTPRDGQWQLSLDGGERVFDQVVITAPAPQALGLLGPDHPLAPALERIRYAPCHTLMVAARTKQTSMPDRYQPEAGPFSLIARDNSKPGRPATPCWVAHTTPAWSEAHLDIDNERVRDELLPAFCETTGLVQEQIQHSDTHRWRYARVTQALGQACLQDNTGTVWIAGDGCLGPRVEAAWQSGRAVAQAIRAWV